MERVRKVCKEVYVCVVEGILRQRTGGFVRVLVGWSIFLDK